MILTGKCREGFEKWYNSNIGKKINVGHLSLYTLSENMVHSVIIDYFDSVGFYILVFPSDNKDNWYFRILEEDIMSPFYENFVSDDNHSTRQEATEKAIEKANDLINNLLTKNK